MNERHSSAKNGFCKDPPEYDSLVDLVRTRLVEPTTECDSRLSPFLVSVVDEMMEDMAVPSASGSMLVSKNLASLIWVLEAVSTMPLRMEKSAEPYPQTVRVSLSLTGNSP